ncbi:hypothetical protein [Novosphingobium mangrovi (ex Hu et al. 2023)]|uniref:DUF4817 domain-containing protein n=1 Tax=Novosphingobium mangrovi (ex Hu et al. 2023) TaxID=2930094 RepID=A0ABT0A9M1_9SPHN|nr:hypothetical protein [Novosphingobium mangrovi (ex Hu et al. 2023)]MCJ1959896.1 hypothetical protein [Novosphingobium mangrovi (ex Hu et al. 2023)]
MIKDLLRRIAKLEARKNKGRRVPNVLNCYHDETRETALEQFRRRWGPIPKEHKFLVIRAYRTADEFRARFRTQQIELRAIAANHSHKGS